MNREEFFRMVSDRPTSELGRIQLAYWLAKNAHRPFLRDNGERYFEHVRAVAVSLVAHGYRGTEFVVDGLMHDVVEDTNTPPGAIVDLFGPETWQHLVVLSKYFSLFDPVTGWIIGRYKKPQEEYFGEIAKAPEMVQIVKCSDRLNNLGDCSAWEPERRKRYRDETERYVLPLARALRLSYEPEIEAALAALPV
jgi:guanosine-3',5'-bis(diphosphate) 3'-pyrophosphohydrolase